MISTTCSASVRTDLAAGTGACGTASRTVASEDFSFMMEAVPGAYINLGNGDTKGSVQVHNPGYDFNDDAIPYGVALFSELVERKLPRGTAD